jgi:hypothetical protein
MNNFTGYRRNLGFLDKKVSCTLEPGQLVRSYADDFAGGPEHECHAGGEVSATGAHVQGPHPRLQLVFQHLWSKRTEIGFSEDAIL